MFTFGLEMHGTPKPERAKAMQDVAKLLQIEQLLDRIVETQSTSVVNAFEKRIETLEKEVRSLSHDELAEFRALEEMQNVRQGVETNAQLLSSVNNF